MTVIGGKLRVTHLVNEDASLGRRGQAGLYQDLPPRRLIEAVASMAAGKIRRAPHRARGDAAVEKLGVQIIKEPLESSPSLVIRHSRAVTIVSDIPNELFACVQRDNLLGVGLASFGPVLLHSATDLSLHCRAHRLSTTNRPVSRDRRSAAATPQSWKRPIDGGEFLLQLLHARLRAAERILFEIESGQMKPPIGERDNPTSYQDTGGVRNEKTRR
jgi:hypothetical protein